MKCSSRQAKIDACVGTVPIKNGIVMQRHLTTALGGLMCACTSSSNSPPRVIKLKKLHD